MVDNARGPCGDCFYWMGFKTDVGAECFIKEVFVNREQSCIEFAAKAKVNPPPPQEGPDEWLK